MNIALILSGGTGYRMGTDIPKQYIEVKERTIIAYSLEILFRYKDIDKVQIVAAPEWHEVILASIGECQNKDKFCGFSEPGVNRQSSILNGLKDIKEYAADEDLVFVHDAARPCLSDKQIADCLNVPEGYDGVMPVLPMKDTVYMSDDGKSITSLLDRSRIYAGQAPEVFKLGRYYDANVKLLPDAILKINGSTEPAVMAGMNIAMIPGDEGNFKITTKEDLERFKTIIA